MKKTLAFLLLILVCGALPVVGALPTCPPSGARGKVLLPYQDARLSAGQRADDLLSRMTLKEKVGQMVCLMGWDSYDLDGRKVSTSEKFRNEVDQLYVGNYWATFRADPWTRKTLNNGLDPERAAMAANAMQRYAIEHSRLGIPLFLAEEAPHGHMAIGTTVFPTGLGLSATFDTALVARVGAAVAQEVRLQGAHVSYGPVIDLARDPRWSRVEETFGEDHVLSGEMAEACIRGMGGGRLQQPFATLATLKHFVAYGVPEGGHNGAPAHVGLRELHECFLPPFQKAIAAGALSVMTAYNAIDGVPCTSYTMLLREVLRQQWGFRGLVVSDLYSIDGLRGTHHVASSIREAGVMAAKAGVDIDLGANAFSQLVSAVENGEIGIEVIDEAVRRILTMKFEMGLFDHPYVDPKAAAREVGSARHVALARQAARESITLLKNDNHLLPLQRNLRVAVVGPNAHNVYNMLGDYTAPQSEGRVSTVLDGILQKIPAAQVTYVRGCAVRDTASCDFEEARMAALQADVVVAVVGGSSARDFRTSYEETGAAVSQPLQVSDMECGEGFDRATLDLMGRQEQLLRMLKSTGKPLVVVYVEGRPLLKNWAARHADALLTAFYPGQEGGNAVADVLFGDYNPAGRLSMSVPRNVGQLPVYYNRQQGGGSPYIDSESTPLYAFGYGLSYTSFRYSDLKVRAAGDGFEVSFMVENTGGREGDEVPQLYLHPRRASVVQPPMQLRHFSRIHLKAGEHVAVTFFLPESDFKVVTPSLQQVVEPGDFDVMVGSSSDNILLRGVINIP